MGIVIDACVLRASGNSGKPVPSSCRDILLAVKSNEVKVLVSKELFAEWRRHKSAFAHAWISSMYSRKLIELIDGFSNEAELIDCALGRLNDADREVALKDSHLLKLAVIGFRKVVSQEEQCRLRFVKASDFFPDISTILWIKPEYDGAHGYLNGLARSYDCPREWFLAREI